MKKTCINNGFSIAGRRIGLNEPPFLIAEMSGNHNQSLDRALKIVDLAAKSGAHALKIQTYKPETMTIDISEREFVVGANSLWTGKSLFELYKEAATPWEWHQPIFDRAIQNGLIPFSTPFDKSSIDFLETLNVPCYKIASFENTDLDLIEMVAKTGKPLIISTGMATLSELDELVSVIRSNGCEDFALLKCTSSYPSDPVNTNLKTIPHMRQLFNCEVGLSDHTMGSGVAVGSVALGATIIEKHFTISRSDGGVDSEFSLEPEEMKILSEELLRVWQGLGVIQYGPTDSEIASLKFRRTLYAVKNIKQGELLTDENTRAIRPGLGLPIKYRKVIIGTAASRDIPRGKGLDWDDIL